MFIIYLITLLMMLGVSKSDEHSTEHGEDVGLDESYQELQTVHKEHHHEAEQGES